MRLRNVIFVLLALFVVFAFASCKQDPQPPAAEEIYELTATQGITDGVFDHDKFSLWFDEEVVPGKTVSFKFRSTRDFIQVNVRGIEGSPKYVYEETIKPEGGNSFELTLGADGWYSFSYTFPEDAEESSDFRVDLRGWIVRGDIFEVKDMVYNGKKIEITEKNTDTKYAVPTVKKIADHEWTLEKKYIVACFVGKPSSSDKYPYVELVSKGGKATLSGLVKTGYEIDKIYNYDKEGQQGDEFNKDTTAINAETFLLVVWKGVERTVTFETNGGSPIDRVIVLNDNLLEQPADPTKEGVLFAGWYKDSEFKTAYDFTQPVTADMTLYARWGAPVDVSFDSQGGSEVATITVPAGLPVEEPEEPTRAMYKFDGWYTEAACTNEYDFSTAVTAAITLYAKWVDAKKVTFNLNYTDAPEPKVVYVDPGAKVAEPENPIRAGFVIDGWYKEAACTTVYDFDSAVNADIELFAKWSYGTMYRLTSTKFTEGYKDDKFVIGFTSDDAKVKAGDIVSISYRTTEAFTSFSIRKNDPETYSKWFHENTSGDKYPQFFSSFEVGDDGWTTVTYEFPEPTDDTETKQIGYGEDGTGFFIYFLNSKMVPGAMAEYRAVTINGVEIELDDSSFNHALTQCAPIWEIVETPYDWKPQTVKFNTDGGTDVADQTVDFGKRASRPETDPVKLGVDFIDWYVDAEFTKVFDFRNVPITKETTIYARYGAPTVVTFDTQGGSAIEPVTVPAGTPVDKPADPTKEGVIFYAWYKEAACTNAYDFKSEVTEAITLYAKWVEPAKITYNLNYTGASDPVVETVGKGIAIDTLKQVGRVGYFFEGWYEDAAGTTAFDASKGISADTTVYAKWSAPTKEYKFTATSSNGRWQLRFKGSAVPILASIQPGDVFTFQVKFTSTTTTPKNYRLRTYEDEKTIQSETTFPEAKDGWYSITITAPEEGSFIGKNGIYLAMFGNADWAIGDICEIKALAYNGQEIKITTSDSSGIYPGIKASLEIIDINLD